MRKVQKTTKKGYENRVENKTVILGFERDFLSVRANFFAQHVAHGYKFFRKKNLKKKF
jgi:hypothetical protein